MTERGLEPSHDEWQHLTAQVMSFAAAFLDGRATAPSWNPPASRALIDELRAAPSAAGVGIETLLERLGRAIDTGFDTAGPGFLSYIPSGGQPTSALGSFLGALTNRYTGAAHASPGAVALEQGVIDWMLDLFGLREGSAGILLSGGSIANLTAVVAARHAFGDDFGSGVVYASDQIHHSIDKAAHIAGIAPGRVRHVPHDGDLRLDVGALEELIDADRADGLRPLLIAATSGTTSTGAVDPLAECARVAERHDAWFHVDAAYGGFFMLTDRGRTAFEGISAADSITVDAHKSLFLPFGIGGLLVRDGNALTSGLDSRGSYMRDVVDGELPHFLALGPELTRPNRGLAIWLPLHLHGVDAFGRELDRMLDLAAQATDALRRIDGIELAHRPELSIVAFRHRDGDATTDGLLDHLNASGEVNVSGTAIDGHTWVRLAFLSQRTPDTVVDRVVDLVVDGLSAPRAAR